MPTIDEIISSDMIELQLYKGDESFLSAADNSHAGEQPTSHSPTGYGASDHLDRIALEWPIDTANADQLTKKLESLRQACEGRVPVGVALCAVSSQQACLIQF